jgi:hypothetical protein
MVLALTEQSEDVFYGTVGSIEVLVQWRRNRWSYTAIMRGDGYGYGRHASAPNLKEVLNKLAQHLSDKRIFLILENSELDKV